MIVDANKFPVIKMLENLWVDNSNIRKYCSTLIKEYNESIHKLYLISDSDYRLFVLRLIKNEHLKRLDESSIDKKLLYIRGCVI